MAALLGTLAAVTAGARFPSIAGLLVTVPMIVVVCKAAGLYDRDELLLRTSTLDEAPGILTVASLYAIVVWLTDRILLADSFDKRQFLALWATLLVVMLLGRKTARYLARRIAEPERCLLLSGNRYAFDRIATTLRLGREAAADVALGVVLEPDATAALIDGGLRYLTQSHHIDRVIIAPGEADSDSVFDLVREAEAAYCKVSLLPRFGEVLGSAVVFDELPAATMLAVRRWGLSRSSQHMKRGFDLVIAPLILLALAPVMLAIAVWIKLCSRGPVFFRQPRIGRDGRAFELLKFRSMVDDADALKESLHHRNEADGLFKIANDPRITGPGRWLRRMSLDELPQLINVIKGDMSLVGPRPLVEEEDNKIQGRHRQRLDLPPGMTGHWQVMGSSRVPLNDMVVIDYLYIANWSLWRDVKCLLRTIPYILGRRGL